MGERCAIMHGIERAGALSNDIYEEETP